MPRTMEIVPDLMPELKSDLARLVAIPSISAPRYPKETHASLVEAYGAVAGLFRDAGARILDPLELPVGDESKWESPPFETAHSEKRWKSASFVFSAGNEIARNRADGHAVVTLGPERMSETADSPLSFDNCPCSKL